MAEEMYAKFIDALREQYGNSDKEEIIRGVFMDAFKLGKEAGFNAGYNKAVNDVDCFQFDDGEDLMIEDVENTGSERFDEVEEMLNF